MAYVLSTPFEQLVAMTKRLLEIDDAVLEAAMAALQCGTITATVNEALRRVVDDRAAVVRDALEISGSIDFCNRERAWR
jgi:Arc/MetJ family transcription regulator